MNKPVQPAGQQPLGAVGYAIIAFVGLAGAIAVGWYLLNNPNLLIGHNASARAYYVLLVLLGLFSGAFLFGVMRSTASISGTYFGAAYEFGGAAAIAVIVVLGGFYLTKPAADFVLFIRLQAAEPINNLTDTWARVEFPGDRRDRRQFSPEGDATFGGVPSSVIGTKVRIEFESKTFRIKQPQNLYEVPPDHVIRLDVERSQASALGPAPDDAGALIERCMNSVQAKQYDIAIERCSEASQKVHDDYRPLHLLGFAQYNQGQFGQAINSYKAALSLPGADVPMIWYNIAFAQSDNKDDTGALESLNKAVSLANGRPALLGRIWFAMASIQQELWLADPANTKLFNDATSSYRSFLEIGAPTFWAHGNLACMNAVRAGRTSLTSEKEAYEKVAAAELKLALDELAKFKNPTAKSAEVEAFRKQFNTDRPSGCAAPLRQAWEHQDKRSYDAQFAGLAP